MSNKKTITICIVFLIFNVLFAFCFMGAPLENIHSCEVPVYVERSNDRRYFRLNSDTVAVNEHGDEFVLVSGYTMCVTRQYGTGKVEISVNDGIPGCEDDYLTVKNADYEDVTDQVREEALERYNESRKEYKVLEMKRYFWFAFPEAGGSLLRGLLAAFVVAYLDGLFFVSCKKRGKFKTFIVINVFWSLAIFMSGVFMQGTDYRR